MGTPLRSTSRLRTNAGTYLFGEVIPARFNWGESRHRYKTTDWLGVLGLVKLINGFW
jgi:hypothetical protein